MTMNTVQKDIDKLLDEVVSNQGWKRFRLGNGHYQIENPNGDWIEVPSSAGHQNAIKQVEDKLKSIGYDRAAIQREEKRAHQEKMTLMREKEAADLAAAVAVAERRAKEEQERLRGSLPPGSRVPGMNPPQWVGFQRIIQVVTPWEAKVALKQLETSACNRRRLKRGNLVDLKSAIDHGRMLFSPEDIVFDEHGCLAEGKHRYEVLANTDPDVLREQYPEYVNERGEPGMLFETVINAPAKLNSVYNTGAGRSPADVLTNSGVTKYETGVAAAIAMLISYDAGKVDWTLYSRQHYPRDVRQTAHETEYKDLLDKALDDMLVLTKKPLKMTQAVALAFAYVAHRDLPQLDVHYIHERGFDTTPWQQFRAGLVLGTDLPPGDARLPFRDYLVGSERYREINNRLVQFFHALKTLEKWNNGEPAKMLKIAKNEAITRFK